MKWAININSDFGFFMEAALLIGGSSDIDWCLVFNREMKSGGGEWANLGAIRPKMTFWVGYNGFALVEAGFDGLVKFSHIMEVVRYRNGASHWEHFTSNWNTKVRRTANDVRVSREIDAEWINNVAKEDSMVGIDVISAFFAGLGEQTAVFDGNMGDELHVDEIHNKHGNIEQGGKKAINQVAVDPFVVCRDFGVLIASFFEILVEGLVIANLGAHLSLLYTHAKRRAIRLTRTIVAPVGVLSMYESVRPKIKQTVDIMTEIMMFWRKVRERFMAVRHGKIMRLETSSAPSIFMPITTVSEQRIARRAL